MSGPGAGWAARFAVLLLVATLWLAAGSRFVVGFWIVAGSSMYPTLRHGEWVMVDRWTLRHRPPQPGELVLLRLPGRRATTAVKRVASVSPDGESLEVLGDNPVDSRDSREFGEVPRSALIGRIAGQWSAATRSGR